MQEIMFNDKYGLTKAVLEGWKTQTGCTIKLKDGEYVNVVALDNGSFMSYVAKDGKPTAYADGNVEMPNFVRPLAPKYFIGEEVAVAQSYREVCYSPSVQETIENELGKSVEDSAGYNNKMFVRADLMPHRIKITNIRMERLQDISDEDCLKEGVMMIGNYKYGVYGIFDKSYKKGNAYTAFDTAKQAFAALIDKTCGKGTWDSNPWVFVYYFELIK